MPGVLLNTVRRHLGWSLQSPPAGIAFAGCTSVLALVFKLTRLVPVKGSTPSPGTPRRTAWPSPPPLESVHATLPVFSSSNQNCILSPAQTR